MADCLITALLLLAPLIARAPTVPKRVGRATHGAACTSADWLMLVGRSPVDFCNTTIFPWICLTRPARTIHRSGISVCVTRSTYALPAFPDRSGSRAWWVVRLDCFPDYSNHAGDHARGSFSFCVARRVFSLFEIWTTNHGKHYGTDGWRSTYTRSCLEVTLQRAAKNASRVLASPPFWWPRRQNPSPAPPPFPSHPLPRRP
jgi:hypothetical protein